MLYYTPGNAIVTEEEFSAGPVQEQLGQFYGALQEQRTPEPVLFSTGVLNLEHATTGLGPEPPRRRGEAPAPISPVPFEPIGMGLPLTIMICEVYTGFHPAGSIFGGAKDMLVTSAVKSYATFEAKPHAMNFLKRETRRKSRMVRGPATETGTPVVFYAPALLDRSLTLDLTILFDSFPQEAFQQVGSAFMAAAGVPIFLTHSPYLLAAGALAKIAGRLGTALLEGTPAFATTEALNISMPGMNPLQRGFAIITDRNLDQVDSTFRPNHEVSAEGQVVHKETKQPYQGDVPYIVVSYDGTRRDELAAFMPTSASAALLSRFLAMKEGQALPLDPLLDAMKLYNDFRYRLEVEHIDAEICRLADGSQKEQLLEKRRAFAANILEDLLKPNS